MSEYGLAYVCLRNSNHVGMLATYGLRVARAGMVGAIMTNSGPSVAAYGGRGKLLGNNAICIAAPADPHPLVLDMATGTVACGKVRLAALHDQMVPLGWLQDRTGRPSQDARDLDEGGCVTPLGGAKGYGLAVAVDILSALLAGGKPSFSVHNQRGKLTHPTGACQAFAVINPDMLLGREELGQAVSAYTAFLRQSTPLDPHLPVLAPGDPELKHGEVTTQNGIVITAPIKKGLDNLARLLGCDSLQ